MRAHSPPQREIKRGSVAIKADKSQLRVEEVDEEGVAALHWQKVSFVVRRFLDFVQFISLFLSGN